jgi:deoxyribose-phosphate aldolase
MITVNIEPIIRKTNAILDEANATPLTGRMYPDVGSVPPNTRIAQLIDHTLLKADATEREIELLCYEAKLFEFASVCVNSVYVPLANEVLRGTPVKVCTVVGFPLGASLPAVKTFEAEQALHYGATEIDMVLHVGALKNRHVVAVFDDISEVAKVCHDRDAITKVILETALLTDEEIVMACQIAKRAGADFVKTSTGFSTAGATLAHIQLMREVVGSGVGVKASGGVRTLADAQAMVKAGANRIGASAGVTIARAESGQAMTDAPASGY